jgi:hypothetical protein
MWPLQKIRLDVRLDFFNVQVKSIIVLVKDTSVMVIRIALMVLTRQPCSAARKTGVMEN